MPKNPAWKPGCDDTRARGDDMRKVCDEAQRESALDFACK